METAVSKVLPDKTFKLSNWVFILLVALVIFLIWSHFVKQTVTITAPNGTILGTGEISSKMSYKKTPTPAPAATV